MCLIAVPILFIGGLPFKIMVIVLSIASMYEILKANYHLMKAIFKRYANFDFFQQKELPYGKRQTTPPRLPRSVLYDNSFLLYFQ